MASPPNPVFDYGDLPAELNGKSGAEIAAYYREQAAAQAPNRNPDPPAPDPSSPITTNQEWYTNPEAAARKIVSGIAVSKGEFERIQRDAIPGLIAVARMTVRDKHSADWANFEADVNTAMRSLSADLQLDPMQWETAYYYVKGLRHDKDVQTARESATTNSSGAELPSGASITPPTPVPLNAEQKYVAEHMGITEDSYKRAKARLETGQWPVTYSNVPSRPA